MLFLVTGISHAQKIIFSLSSGTTVFYRDAGPSGTSISDSYDYIQIKNQDGTSENLSFDNISTSKEFSSLNSKQSASLDMHGVSVSLQKTTGEVEVNYSLESSNSIQLKAIDNGGNVLYTQQMKRSKGAQSEIFKLEGAKGINYPIKIVLEIPSQIWVVGEIGK